MGPNRYLTLAQHPTALPIPGEDLVIRTSEIDLTTPPPPGCILLKKHYLSYDPYQRGRMRKPAVASYNTSYALDAPLDNNAISSVILSSNPRFKPGDVVVGTADYSEYQLIGKERADEPALTTGRGGFSKLSNPLGLDPKLFLGALGMSGLTAYSSFYEIGKPKKGDVIFISAASGAVGQIVGQLAKRDGLIVIGSVGSDDKLEFIKKELGFDAGFNYKNEQPLAALQRILKQLDKPGLSIYYDNVGGEQLDAALATMGERGRIISCGSVSQSSRGPGETYGIKNMPLVVGKRITIRGFIVFDEDMGPAYTDEHQRNMQKWIKDGEIKIKMHVTEGIEKSAEGLVGMLSGLNFGKAVLKISEI